MDSARHCAWNVSYMMWSFSLPQICYDCKFQRCQMASPCTHRCERDNVHHAVHKCLNLNVYAPVPLFLSSVEVIVRVLVNRGLYLPLQRFWGGQRGRARDVCLRTGLAAAWTGALPAAPQCPYIKCLWTSQSRLAQLVERVTSTSHKKLMTRSVVRVG